MKNRLLPVLLSLLLALSGLPCPALGAEPEQTGPLGEEAVPTLIDTGRGYIVYYWYASGIYFSEDGVTWTDLSDRQWVRDAAPYVYTGVGHLGHREFELLWTGTEYMMRQSLLDDPRSAYRRHGDSPRNCLVTFLDEEFQIIGEMAFDGPVTGIRCEDGTCFAAVGGEEIAFPRSARASDPLSPDSPADGRFASRVLAWAEERLAQDVPGGTVPKRQPEYRDCLILAMCLYDLHRGGIGLPEIAAYFS